MNVHKVAPLFLLGLLLGGVSPRTCLAQPPDSTTGDSTTGPIVPSGGEEWPEPYKHWKIHSGKPTECVATVHVDARAGEPAFTVSGLVVRCDGFVLVPRSAYERLKVKGATGSVSVIGAEGETISAPIPLAGWQYAPADGRYPDYGLVKINNHHVRCLPLLSANVIQKDLAVDIVFATDDSKPGLCIAHSYTAGVMRVPDGTEHTARNPEHFALVNIRPEGSASADPNPADAAAIPLGAVVIDHESGAAIGMVTGAATGTEAQPIFANMAQFGRTFNDVAIVPSRTSIAYQHVKNVTLPAGMLFIPGGPTKLYGDVAEEYRHSFGTDIVCMPDFECDKFPVTNLQFRDWLAGPGAGMTWPRGWPVDEVRNPVRRDDLPVPGVPSDSARAYASEQDKRLLTEAEWQRAALIYKVPMNVKPETQTNALLEAFRQLKARLNDIMRQRAEVAALMPDRRNHPEENAVYNLMHDQLPPDTLEFFKKVQDQASDLAPSGGIFGEVHPVETYPGDFSVFGVRDIVSNPVELLLNKGRQERLGPTKIFQAFTDPYVSYMDFIDGQKRAFHYFIDIGPATGLFFAERILLDAGLTLPLDLFMGEVEIDPTGHPFTIGITVSHFAYPEFRCAR